MSDITTILMSDGSTSSHEIVWWYVVGNLILITIAIYPIIKYWRK